MRTRFARLVLLVAILCAGAVTIGVTALSRNTALLRSLEHWTTDWRTALLADRAASQHPGLAVVLIDDDTLEGLPYRSPIDRALLARLVETLDGTGARVIGLDFMFDQPTEPEKDRQLIAALKKAADRIVIGTVDERVPLKSERREHLANFAREAGVATGYLNLRYELDRVIRGEAEPAPGGGTTESFAGAIARRSGIDPGTHAPRIAWLATPEDGSDAFLVLPAGQIVAPSDELERKMAELLLAQVKGRIVLVGGDVSDQIDRHPTPLSNLTGEPMPGVLIHAHAVAQRLDGRRLSLLAPHWETALIFAMAFVGFLLGWRFRASGWITSAIPVAILGALDAIFFAGSRTIIPFAAPALAWVAAVLLGRGVRATLAILTRR
jgi:CHASE2 domain-containing sensor protein